MNLVILKIINAGYLFTFVFPMLCELPGENTKYESEVKTYL